jgi:hypothetical protein
MSYDVMIMITRHPTNYTRPLPEPLYWGADCAKLGTVWQHSCFQALHWRLLEAAYARLVQPLLRFSTIVTLSKQQLGPRGHLAMCGEAQAVTVPDLPFAHVFPIICTLQLWLSVMRPLLKTWNWVHTSG